MPREYVVLELPEPVALSASYPRRVKPDNGGQVIVSSWPDAFIAQERSALEAADIEILTEAQARAVGSQWDQEYLDAHPDVKEALGL